MFCSYLILSFIVEEIQAVINDAEDNKEEESETGTMQKASLKFMYDFFPLIF